MDNMYFDGSFLQAVVLDLLDDMYDFDEAVDYISNKFNLSRRKSAKILDMKIGMMFGY